MYTTSTHRLFAALAAAAISLLPQMTEALPAPLKDAPQIVTVPQLVLPKEAFPAPLANSIDLFNAQKFEEALVSAAAFEPRKRDFLPLARRDFLKGLCLFKLNNFGDAEQAFASSLNYRRTESDVVYFLGAAELSQGKKQEALRAFEESFFYGTSKLVPYAEIAVKLAGLYRADNRPLRATTILNTGIAKTPGYGPALLMLSELQGDKGGKPAAIALLRAGIAQNPEDNDEKLSLAEQLLSGANRSVNAPDIAEAKSLTESVLASKAPLTDSLQVRARALHIRSLFEGGDTSKAKTELANAMKTFPENPQFKTLQAQIEVEETAAQAAAAATPEGH